ncbi:hypothetical protein ABEW61_00275 [Paenibacillus amylolyticus]|uniref:hypothetical protein n=1 Tax=Paenibacillus amylolyticus TaxID=1451 RepID=UPI003D2B88AE
MLNLVKGIDDIRRIDGPAKDSIQGLVKEGTPSPTSVHSVRIGTSTEMVSTAVGKPSTNSSD